MNLTQEQQAKIFAQRIGQNVRTAQNVLPLRKLVRPSEQYTGPIVGVFKRRVNGDQWFVRVFIEGTHYEAAPDQFKLLLRPLSALTDEHALHITSLIFTNSFTAEESIWIGRALTLHNFTLKRVLENIPVEIDSNRMGVVALHIRTLRTLHVMKIQQFLLDNGYDIPIYPHNATAIELGLAIDSSIL